MQSDHVYCIFSLNYKRTWALSKATNHPKPLGIFHNRNPLNLDSSDQQIRLCCGLNLIPDS